MQIVISHFSALKEKGLIFNHQKMFIFKCKMSFSQMYTWLQSPETLSWLWSTSSFPSHYAQPQKVEWQLLTMQKGFSFPREKNFPRI